MSLKSLKKCYSVRRVSSGKYLESAKKLHASVYLAQGFVRKDDIESNGQLHSDIDQFASHADYFVAIDNDTDEVVALVRQIHQRTGMKLPVLHHKMAQKNYAHTHDHDIIEVSAFAKKKGVDSRVTILLFSEMLRYSKQNNHQYWVFACDSKVYGRLKILFGKLLQKTGPETYYMGSKVIPAEVNLDAALKQLRRNYRYSIPPLRHVRHFLYESLTTLSYQSEPKTGIISSTFWDQYSKAYDGLLYLAPYRHLVDHVSDLALQSMPKRVLDLGCGTGNVAVAILKKDQSVHVDAVDWSSSMLSYLPPKTNGNRLTIRRRDAIEYLKETDQLYDVIVLNNVVYTIRDRKRFWTLVSARLHPGGRVVVAHPDTGNSSSLIKDHTNQHSFVSLIKPRLIMIGMFDTVISFLGLSQHYAFTPQAELLEQASQSGLQLDGDVGRCYGGHINGIDILFTLKKPIGKV